MVFEIMFLVISILGALALVSWLFACMFWTPVFVGASLVLTVLMVITFVGAMVYELVRVLKWR